MTLRIRPGLRPLKAWLSDVIGGSGHHTQFRHGLEVTLRSDGGLVGHGEASPLPNFSLELLDDVEAELLGIGAFDFDAPETPEDCRACIDNVVHSMHLRTASARFACEGALLDLLARHFELPAATLTAKMTSVVQGAAPSSSSALEVSRLLPPSDLPRLVAAARKAWARGYRTLKLKLGPFETFEDDCRKVEALREQLPPTVKLRLDPNGSWPIAELPRMLARLSRLSPDLVEEPVPADILVGLPSSPVELGLDESMRAPGVLERMAPHLERLRIRAVIIKPALLGFLNALAIAERARNLGLDVIVTHLFDGPVGHATAACLAQAVGSTARAHGLAPHPGLLLCPERRILGLGGGILNSVEQPGLPLSEVNRC